MDLPEFKAFAATRIELAALQLQGLLDHWEGQFPADALSGREYPFTMSLDEQIDQMRGAVEELTGITAEPDECARCGHPLGLCTPIMCARLDSDGQTRTRYMQDFIDQNSETMKGFTQEMADQAEGYAEHYSGGLLVLVKRTPTGCLKMHDTWGDDGPVVVHHYGLDDEGLDAGSDTDPHEWVAHFQTGTEAFRLFRTIEEA